MSAKTKPSRSTTSPSRTGTASENIGPALTKVWNSPFSPQDRYRPAGRPRTRDRKCVRQTRDRACAGRRRSHAPPARRRSSRPQARAYPGPTAETAAQCRCPQAAARDRRGCRPGTDRRTPWPQHRAPAPWRRTTHDALVVGVRAGIGNVDHMQREARSLRLRLQQRSPYGMHGHAVEGGVDRGEQPGHLVLAASPQHLQAPGRVLARTPAQPRLHQVTIPALVICRGHRQFFPLPWGRGCEAMTYGRVRHLRNRAVA